jgi:DNA-binding protein H-NS
MECDEHIDWTITQKHYENGEIHLCSACEKLRDDMLNEQVEKDMYESSASSKETNESSEEVKDFLDKLNEYYKRLQKSNISAKFHIEYSESTPSS